MVCHTPINVNEITPHLNKTRIISSGIHLPEKIVSSIELFEEFKSDLRYGTPVDWMSERMGIVERRVAPLSATPSSLAIPACEQALANAPDIPLNEIDMVIFCGIERDQPEPATAHVIQDTLGLNAKYAYDIANACFGFINGMEMADQFIRSGAIKYALICTGETPTKVLERVIDLLKAGVDRTEYRDRIGGLSVGDAGGAILLGPSHNSEGFEGFNTKSVSNHIEKCIYKWHADGSITGQMKMGPIVKAIINEHKALFQDTLNKLKWGNFDWLLTHQMGAKPFERFSNLSGVESKKMIKTYPKLGNITSATFPIGFHKLRQSGQIKPGDKVGGCFAGSGLAIGQFGYTA